MYYRVDDYKDALLNDPSGSKIIVGSILGYISDAEIKHLVENNIVDQYANVITLSDVYTVIGHSVIEGDPDQVIKIY